MNSLGQSSRPPSRRRVVGLGLASLVVVVLVAGGYGIWYLFLGPSAPAAVGEASLPPVPTASPDASASVGASASAGASSASTTSDATDETWTVNTSIGSFSDFTSSFVGYRVEEQLASIGANTAVGRTPNVSGSLTIDGTTVMAARIEADLTTLQSDDHRRDGQLARQGIQTGSYPTATFTLSEPTDLGSIPADGEEIQVTASGQLTLHGVTNDVQIPLTARLSGDVVTVVGSLPIVFADYGIPIPNSFLVLSIADQGTMELQLFFTRA